MRRHIYQAIERKQIDLTAHQIRNTWLCHTEQLGGLGVTGIGEGQMVFRGQYQGRTKLQVFRFFESVLDSIPYVGKPFIFIG